VEIFAAQRSPPVANGKQSSIRKVFIIFFTPSSSLQGVRSLMQRVWWQINGNNIIFEQYHGNILIISNSFENPRCTATVVDVVYSGAKFATSIVDTGDAP
jgi:hypothetical protein